MCKNFVRSIIILSHNRKSILINMFKYTIIIPHKNIPNLLQRCLDSIPKRDDVQIIVVDDNSEPQKVDFSHFPGLGEKCVEVYFTKDGKGAGYARNIGIQHAKGEWVLFADADDYYDRSLLDILDQSLDDSYDILFYNFHSYIKELENRYQSYYITGNEDPIRYIWTPWNKVFSRKLIINNNLLFDEIQVGNDAMFCLKANYIATKVKIILDKLYYYTNDNTNSITLKYKSFTKELNRLDINIKINTFLKRINKTIYCIPVLHPKTLCSIRNVYGFKSLVKYIQTVISNGSFFEEISVLGLYVVNKIKQNRLFHSN